jgi:hypothetical protein
MERQVGIIEERKNKKQGLTSCRVAQRDRKVRKVQKR